MKRSGSSPPSSVTIFSLNPSSVSSAIDFSAAFVPAASGSKFTTTFEVCRLRIATCCSVKAVPLVAITF